MRMQYLSGRARTWMIRQDADDVPAHPYAVAMESAMLAPNAEVSMFPGKNPKSGFPRQCAKSIPSSRRIGLRKSRRRSPDCSMIHYTFGALWGGWLLFWLASARGNKRTATRTGPLWRFTGWRRFSSCGLGGDNSRSTSNNRCCRRVRRGCTSGWFSPPVDSGSRFGRGGSLAQTGGAMPSIKKDHELIQRGRTDSCAIRSTPACFSRCSAAASRHAACGTSPWSGWPPSS